MTARAESVIVSLWAVDDSSTSDLMVEIVSLWSVDDGSTAFLMTEFYQNLQQKMDKATALRKAMLDTKKKYSNPSQWAAFTLIGESQ